ncbi:tetratricopeptide repeat protein [Candidatus Omnitrophota bacterium]
MSGLRRITLFLLFLILAFPAAPEIFYLDHKKEGMGAEEISEERVYIKLRFEAEPQNETPLFIYNVVKTSNPYKIPEELFKQSVFLLERGNFYFSQDNYPKAIEFYLKALDVNPSFRAAYHNLATVHFLRSDYTKSREYFERLIALEPLDGGAYYYLGWIFKRLENKRAAEHYLSTARELFSAQGQEYMRLETERLLSSLDLYGDD